MEAATRLFAECSKCDKDNCQAAAGRGEASAAPALHVLLYAEAPAATGMLKRINQIQYLALNHTGRAQLKHLQLKFFILQHRLVILGLHLRMASVP